MSALNFIGLVVIELSRSTFVGLICSCNLIELFQLCAERMQGATDAFAPIPCRQLYGIYWERKPLLFRRQLLKKIVCVIHRLLVTDQKIST